MSISTTARQEYYLELGNCLPFCINHTKENHERRMTTAVESFNDLDPGNAWEGRLAVQIVLAGAHAAQCLSEARQYGDGDPKCARVRAQAASLMREERAARRMLEKEKKLRLEVADVAERAATAPVTAGQPASTVPSAASAPRQAAPASAPAQAAAPQARPAQPAPVHRPAPVPRPVADKSRDKATAPAAHGNTPAVMVPGKLAQATPLRGVAPTIGTKAALLASALPSDPAMLDIVLGGTAAPNVAAAANAAVLKSAA